MSDNDLIRRGDVLKKAVYLDIGGNERFVVSVVFKLDIEEIPAVPQEMTAREFVAALDEICDSTNCAVCPLKDACDCEYGCTSYDLDLTKALPIIEAWVREHPEGGKR